MQHHSTQGFQMRVCENQINQDNHVNVLLWGKFLLKRINTFIAVSAATDLHGL